MAIYSRPTSWLYFQGAIGGIVAGIVLAVADSAMTLTLGGSAFGPMRLIASIVLGTAALSPAYPLAVALPVGVITHLLNSAVYGVIFVYLLVVTNRIASSDRQLLLYGTLYGFAVWVVTILIVGALAFPQFLTMNQFWNGFVAHTFFYGTVLGAYLAVALPTGAGVSLGSGTLR